MVFQDLSCLITSLKRGATERQTRQRPPPQNRFLLEYRPKTSHDRSPVQFVFRLLAFLPGRAQQAGNALAALPWHAGGDCRCDRAGRDWKMVAVPPGAGSGVRVRLGGPLLCREKSARDVSASAVVVHG